MGLWGGSFPPKRAPGGLQNGARVAILNKLQDGNGLQIAENKDLTGCSVFELPRTFKVCFAVVPDGNKLFARN